MYQQYVRLLSCLLCLLQLKMRAGGMSESSKWKKQKRSPRPPRHLVRSPSGQMDPAQSSTLSNNNLSGDNKTLKIISEPLSKPSSFCLNLSVKLGGVLFIEQGISTCGLPASDSGGSSISSPTATDSGLETCSKATSRDDLSDMEHCNSIATTPNTATFLPGTEPCSEDAQVGRSTFY